MAKLRQNRVPDPPLSDTSAPATASPGESAAVNEPADTPRESCFPLPCAQWIVTARPPAFPGRATLPLQPWRSTFSPHPEALQIRLRAAPWEPGLLIFSRLCWRSAAFSSPWTVYPKLCGQRSRPRSRSFRSTIQPPRLRPRLRRASLRDKSCSIPAWPKPFTSYPASPFVPRWATPGGSSCGAPKIREAWLRTGRSVLELIRALGREDPLPALPGRPRPEPTPSATATTGVFHASPHSRDGLSRSPKPPCHSGRSPG